MTYLDKTGSLTPFARSIICDKATEHPNTGKYNALVTQGTYLCRRCGIALFRAHSQFTAGCGWPSFDEEIPGCVHEIPDSDGRRTEILCNRCQAHLGHVFLGEQLTPRNRRYCVNAASIDFVVDDAVFDTEEALVAGGCFWGVDYYLRRLPGVLHVEVGYCGGITENPTYEEVCQGNTGHYEAVRIIYDRPKTTYRAIIQHFFEIHDPTQRSGQGPDRGPQYQSVIFYYTADQAEQAQDLMHQLQTKGFQVVTRLMAVKPFWPAEAYHQDYYSHHNKTPYCHKPINRFGAG